MSIKLNDMLVCPICKGSLLKGDGKRAELICHRCKLAFEIRHDIPVMLRNAARELTENEAQHYSDRASKLDPK